jgi:hypothetical protein
VSERTGTRATARKKTGGSRPRATMHHPFVVLYRMWGRNDAPPRARTAPITAAARGDAAPERRRRGADRRLAQPRWRGARGGDAC